MTVVGAGNPVNVPRTVMLFEEELFDRLWVALSVGVGAGDGDFVFFFFGAGDV